MEENYYDYQDKDFYEFAQKLTDRQLLEKQAHYQYLQAQYSKRIMKNVSFFFWITIIGFIIGILLFVTTIK